MAEAPRGPVSVHIAGHFNGACGQTLVYARGIHACQLGQRCSATGDGLAVGIQQLHAQRLQHASAAIVGSAAAQAQNQVACTGIQRGQDEFPCAVAGREQWVALLAWHQGQAAGCSHLDHGHAAVA